MFSIFHKNIPTLDIYFRAPLKALIAEGPFLFSKQPIKRLGPNSFFANGQVVIIRYITTPELNKIRALKPKRCFYLIDDDLEALASDTSLPEDYRKRLMQFASQHLPEILALADTVIAPNEQIFKAYPGKTHLLLNPSYSALCQDFSHFDDTSTINILFSGTRSHLNDLLLISDTMVDICRQHPHVRFTTFMGGHAPDNLKGFENIEHRKAKSWDSFKHVLCNERFHIALAPYQDTKFNSARSINKLLDHAALGAAGLYSNRLPFLDIIKHGKNGLLINDNHQDWHNAIESLISDIKTSRHLAENGALLAAKLGDLEHVRSFWMDKLLYSSQKGFRVGETD